MTTAKWRQIKPSRVLVDSIIPTQEHLCFDALAAPPGSHCGDAFPHCVLWGGKLYLNDGHHRLIRAKLDRAVTMDVRVAVPFAHFRPCF